VVEDGYVVTPPVMSVVIQNNMDIMIAGDVARRAAGLLEFTPIFQAQLSGAVMALADLVSKTNSAHELNITGIQGSNKIGIQVKCPAPWLANESTAKVVHALRAKLGQLVDEIDLQRAEDVPCIVLILWLLPPRKARTS
jgi:hypothetical protein